MCMHRRSLLPPILQIYSHEILFFCWYCVIIAHLHCDHYFDRAWNICKRNELNLNEQRYNNINDSISSALNKTNRIGESTKLQWICWNKKLTKKRIHTYAICAIDFAFDEF